MKLVAVTEAGLFLMSIAPAEELWKLELVTIMPELSPGLLLELAKDRMDA